MHCVESRLDVAGKDQETGVMVLVLKTRFYIILCLCLVMLTLHASLLLMQLACAVCLRVLRSVHAPAFLRIALKPMHSCHFSCGCHDQIGVCLTLHSRFPVPGNLLVFASFSDHAGFSRFVFLNLRAGYIVRACQPCGALTVSQHRLALCS